MIFRQVLQNLRWKVLVIVLLVLQLVPVVVS